MPYEGSEHPEPALKQGYAVENVKEYACDRAYYRLETDTVSKEAVRTQSPPVSTIMYADWSGVAVVEGDCTVPQAGQFGTIRGRPEASPYAELLHMQMLVLRGLCKETKHWKTLHKA